MDTGHFGTEVLSWRGRAGFRAALGLNWCLQAALVILMEGRKVGVGGWTRAIHPMVRTQSWLSLALYLCPPDSSRVGVALSSPAMGERGGPTGRGERP